MTSSSFEELHFRPLEISWWKWSCRECSKLCWAWKSLSETLKKAREHGEKFRRQAIRLRHKKLSPTALYSIWWQSVLPRRILDIMRVLSGVWKVVVIVSVDARCHEKGNNLMNSPVRFISCVRHPHKSTWGKECVREPFLLTHFHPRPRPSDSESLESSP